MALIASLAVLFVCAPANADTASCARTLEDARKLDARGELHEALRALEACSRCDALADVCAATRARIRSAMPTVTVSVRGPDGRPIPNATVVVDGARYAQNAAVDVDPGAHVVRAELGDRVERRLVVMAEGEAHRATLTLAPCPASQPMPPSVIALGAGSGVALATAAGLWAWSQTVTAPHLFAPVAPQPRGGLLIGAGAALAAAIVGAVVAVVLYAAR